MASTIISSILTSIKKLLGIAKEDTNFDSDITMHINSVIMALTQIGVGPADGFFIQDETATWEDFLGVRKDLNSVVIYVYFKVRLAFDPPQSGPLLEAINRQITELEVRLNIQAETTPVVEGGTPVG